MVFRGTIVRHCLVWRQWRERRATGGLIEGVQFSFVPGDNYATGDLSAAEVTRLRALPQTVRLEAFGAAEPPVSPQGEQMRQELLADVIDPSPPPPPLPVPSLSVRVPHTPGWRARQRAAAAAGKPFPEGE